MVHIMTSLIKKLILSGKKVFSSQEIALYSEESDRSKLNKRIGYYLKSGELFSIRRGIYSLTKNYDHLEVANRIFTPSYISLQTVLLQEGTIFQHYKQIFLISYLNREIFIDEKTIVFKKIKNSVLLNPEGIIQNNNYNIASLERAFLDTVYLYPGYYFDNLRKLDWDICFELVDIYSNKAMLKRLDKYYKEASGVR